MSFGGHVLEMIILLKNNRAQRPSQRKKFKEDYPEGSRSNPTAPKPLQFAEVSKEELEKVKKRIREKAKKGRKQRMAFGLILVLIGIAFAVWIADKMI